MNYSVILHRSERISKIFGTDNKTDTYVANVDATDLRTAITTAKMEVLKSDECEPSRDGGRPWKDYTRPTPDDYTVLLVLKGPINVLLYGWQQ